MRTPSCQGSKPKSIKACTRKKRDRVQNVKSECLLDETTLFNLNRLIFIVWTSPNLFCVFLCTTYEVQWLTLNCFNIFATKYSFFGIKKIHVFFPSEIKVWPVKQNVNKKNTHCHHCRSIWNCKICREKSVSSVR